MRTRPALAAVGALLAIVMGGILGAGTSMARPSEAPRVAVYGDIIWTAGGNHANCRGGIKVSLKTDPAHRGVVYATYTPLRFTGDGPNWKRRPVCTTRVWSNWGIQVPGHNWSPLIVTGPRGGKPVHKTLFTGSGVQAMGFGTAGAHHSIADYLLVP
ncbi:hypothetical protein GOEFS_119_00050 [Gordonia effusa NBRC 100432]|uniref:Uncharacterized protein n=1 Tax=Gordonia effusa NBRC 100432 TaxID=1077974 RepID=H0R614_9ACTN|nr:hypothetical protein [Gordonia effusa]GAB20515.1 hypothetical protein GOEFS_119_00050 [Gordonia effusa NBRC 100432]